MYEFSKFLPIAILLLSLTHCSEEQLAGVQDGVYSCTVDTLSLIEERKRITKIDSPNLRRVTIHVGICDGIPAVLEASCKATMSEEMEEPFTPAYVYSDPLEVITSVPAYAQYEWGNVAVNGKASGVLGVTIIRPANTLLFIGDAKFLNLDSSSTPVEFTHFSVDGEACSFVPRERN